jgi:predicted DNA-binding transcriptional regulator AlpA
MNDPFILKSDRKGLRHFGIPLSPSSAMRHVKAGGFPAPVALTPGRVGWFASTLQTWLDAKRAT